MFGGRAIKAFTLFGITVYLHWSLLLLVVMLSFNIAASPKVPWWGGCILGTVFAFLLLLSVVVHEFAHSLVGRKYGVGFSQITLFIFGGAAKMDNDVTYPKAELYMASAGPAASFAIYLLCTVLLNIVSGFSNGVVAQVIAGVLELMASLNLLMAGFNMIPAFPMDGGRVLRAAIWHFKGKRKATRIAAYTGKAFGYALITCGVFMAFGITVPFFGTGASNGVWIGLMGWLISGMANAELQRSSQYGLWG